MPSTIFDATVQYLKDQVTEKRYFEVNQGFEEVLGVSTRMLRRALHELNTQGYLTHFVRLTQHGSGKPITVRVFALPDVTHQEVLEAVTSLHHD